VAAAVLTQIKEVLQHTQVVPVVLVAEALQVVMLLRVVLELQVKETMVVMAVLRDQVAEAVRVSQEQVVHQVLAVMVLHLQSLALQ
jgi:hypothetical protein